MAIYDCFNFFNELDILELRLNILYEYVDYFIIAEANVKHSGEQKPFYFEENKERFSKFIDKIILCKILDTPKSFHDLQKTENNETNKIFDYIKIQKNRFDIHTQPDYGRDFFQKESVRKFLTECEDNDIILISDADEIPNPEILLNLQKLDLENNIYSLNQNTYYYFLNVLKQKDWYGTKMGLYKNIKKYSLNEIRGDESLSSKLKNGGWHFSFMGGKEMVKNKLTSYSARDLASHHVISEIENNILNNVDPFFRSRLTKVEIDSTYPKYIQENLEKYRHMIKP